MESCNLKDTRNMKKKMKYEENRSRPKREEWKYKSYQSLVKWYDINSLVIDTTVVVVVDSRRWLVGEPSLMTSQEFCFKLRPCGPLELTSNR